MRSMWPSACKQHHERRMRPHTLELSRAFVQKPTYAVAPEQNVADNTCGDRIHGHEQRIVTEQAKADGNET